LKCPDAISCATKEQEKNQAKAEATERMTGSARPMVIGLMVPMGTMILNLVMFSVALPTIRDDFVIPADTAAWLVTAYILPFVTMMPLYGRLGDGLGKRRLLLIGISIFGVGTLIALLAIDLQQLLLGRVIQGLGAGAINPLSMAIISERFPAAERGQALGTWNSMGPIAGIIAPLLGGFLTDTLGWRTIFGPVALLAVAAILAVAVLVPPGQRSFIQSGFLRTFDWGGVALLGATITILLFYASSRAITGIEALRDWRLLLLTVSFLAGFLYWEKRRSNPFVPLEIFTSREFNRASLGAGIRMFVMTSISFLTPLYLADVHSLSAAAIGVVIMIHAGALFVTMRFGGQLADRWGSRRPVVAGSSVQLGGMLYFALLPGSAWLGWVVAGLIGHGLGAGLSLAALHRSAMGRIPPEQTGVAAGLYSMFRFGGTALGTALGGVILQYGLDQSLLTVQAYQLVFWFIAGVALLGVINGWGLRE
jgi:EmrB/QacA subfamily drug resistance transporter